MCDYKVVGSAGEGEIVEKKSRFIAHVMPVKTEQEAAEFIEKIKKKYWDARHNCSAYVIGPNNELTRCSDDGEPSGTAGRPMLEVLLNEGIHNVCVVVTRYFGGVLLGTGGLVRAYQASVKEGLANSQVATVHVGIKYKIVIEYTDLTPVQKFFEKNDYYLENIEYSDKVLIEGVFAGDKEQHAVDGITSITNGKAQFENLGECEYIS